MAELNETEQHIQQLTSDDFSKEKIQQTALQELRKGNYDFALKAIQKGGVDFSELIENLKIYQAELEIQNEELREANLKKDTAFQRFSQLFDYLPLPVFVIDSYGIIHNANFSAENRFNMSLQALRSHYFPRLVSKSHHHHFRNLINQATETGLPVSNEILLHPNQQAEFTADLNVVSLANQSSELQFIVTIIDQTQRIQQTNTIELQRRRFAAYFETAPVGIATISSDKQWLDVNQTLCQLLGYSRTELLKSNWLKLTHSDDIEKDELQFNRLINHEISNYRLEIRLLHKYGAVIPVEMGVYCERKKSGEIDYIIKTVVDLTQRKHDEQQLLERDARLEQQAKALSARIKQINAIYALSKLNHQESNITVFFKKIVDIIPSGLAYPEKAQVSLTFQGCQYATSGINDLTHFTQYQIGLQNGGIVELKIGYQPLDDKQLAQEDKLYITAIAELVTQLCNKYDAEQQQQLSFKRNQALLKLTTQATHMEEAELLQYALNQAQELTVSQLGYIYFVSEDQTGLTLCACSNRKEFNEYYAISETALLLDTLRIKKSIVYNDNLVVKDKPCVITRHGTGIRYMSTPVLNDDAVVLIMGVGDKADDYNEVDNALLEIIANNTWILLQHNRNRRLLELHAQVFRSSCEGVMITNNDVKIISVNHAFTRITGYSVTEVYGQSPSILKSGKHDAAFYQAMWQEINTYGHWQGEIWNRRKNGDIYPQWLSISSVKTIQGHISEYIAVFSDITEYKDAQARYEYLATHDALTGLPNRILLKDRFVQAHAQAMRLYFTIAMIYLDLDHFKNINDSLGHPVGDKLLIEAASRLKKCTRDGDTVSRVGGDEFVIILTGLQAAEDSADAAQKILKVISESFYIDGSQFNLSCSIGISICPNDGADFDTLLKKADTALYQSKSCGRNTYQFFTAEMNQKAMLRMSLDIEMRRGYELNEFTLFYQPQYEMSSGKIKGAEALIRWHHATKGYISPIEFITVAEDTGFINTLGQFVIERACQQAKLWIELGYPIVIAVNVSAVQFASNNNLLEQILSSLERSGLPPNYLELELTESTLALQPDKLMQIMNQLRSCGVRFSVDDFGTGYSNLSYLKSFPLDKIKIDQSFVRDIPGDSHDEGLIKSIINLAASLELNCIAEGVETSDQVDFLNSLGCEEAQGYFFARPLPSVELTELLARK